MSIIKKHDIVDNILTMEDLEKRIHDIIGEKKRWEEMNESERDKLIKLCQSKCLKEKNIEFKLSYPFMKQTTIDTFEIFSGTIARNNQSVLLNLKTNKRVNCLLYIYIYIYIYMYQVGLLLLFQQRAHEAIIRSNSERFLYVNQSLTHQFVHKFLCLFACLFFSLAVQCKTFFFFFV